MMPLIPPSTINDMAAIHYQESPEDRHSSLSNPDRVFGDGALQPDPVFMGLRTLVTTGPIGRLVARYETWREAREDRQIAAEQAVEAASRIVSSQNLSPTTIAERETVERDLAA